MPTLDIGTIWRTFWSQSIAFKLTCVYLLFEYVRPQSIWPVIDVLPYAQLLILTGLVGMLVEVGKFGRTKSPANGLLLAFSVIVLLSMIFSYYPAIAFGHWATYMPWVLVFFLITNTAAILRRLPGAIRAATSEKTNTSPLLAAIPAAWDDSFPSREV